MNESENIEGVTRFEAGMPPLNLNGSLRSKRFLGYLLGVSVPKEPKGKRIVDGLVRLSDKAISEYQDTREKMLNFFRKGNPDNLHRAQDHFESCVQSLHRGINFLDRLRGLGYIKIDGSPLVARPRELEILREPVRSRICDFRDYIEHIEDDIIAGSVHDDQPVSIHLGWERATIKDATLDYRDIARWCTQLYEVAEPLSVVKLTFRPPTTNLNQGA